MKRPPARVVRARLSVAAAWSVVLASGVPAAEAQVWQREASVDTTITATDNATQASGAEARADVLTTIRPALRLAARGTRFEFDLNASALALQHARGTRADRIVPSLLTEASAMLAERLIYLDAAAAVQQVEADPYAGRVDDGDGSNRRTERSYRLSPYLKREIAPGVEVLARFDETVSRLSGDGGRLRSRQTRLAYDVEPMPWGYGVELTTLDLRAGTGRQEHLSLDGWRLHGSVLLGGETVVGPVLGHDRSELQGAEERGAVWGLRLLWQPGPRTRVAAELERRFYGLGGEIEVRHRMPWTAFALQVRRGPDVPEAEARNADLGSFLGAILTTRHPDPLERDALVRDLITQRGLQADLPRPVGTLAGQARLRTSAEATWVWLGTRNTLSATVYLQRRERFAREFDDAAVDASAGDEDRQFGWALELNRRLAPRLTVDGVLRWSRLRGLGARSDDRSDERSLRIAFVQELSPRTGASVGALHRRLSASGAGLDSFDETAVFVGLTHRF